MTQLMVGPQLQADEGALVASSQEGDERAFATLTRPLQRQLHVHCYRMLGSLDDADDALQETMLRAWRQINRFEPRAPFRAWLYRIATNVCLTILARQGHRREVALLDPEVDRHGEWRQEGEPVHLQPYPDHLLDEIAQAESSPEATTVRREDVELAFVSAVQLLPSRQRATLLLRDVIGYSAAEVASMLETSVAAVNSASQRARATLANARIAALVSREHAPASAAIEQELVRRLVAAWHAADVPAIVAILTEDALLTMPPLPDRYLGREAIGAFLSTTPAGGRLDRFRLVPMRANAQPALAAYFRDTDAGPFQAHAILVLAIQGDSIASLVRFADAALFPRFGLPLAIEG